MPKYKKHKTIAGATAKGPDAQLGRWLQTGDFSAVMTLLQRQTEWSRDERYAYGYALLRSKDLVRGLAAWAPLFGKYGAAFDEDCHTVTRTVLLDQPPAWGELSRDDLLSLFHIARKVQPDHPVTQSLASEVFRQLWAATDQESLKMLLKMRDLIGKSDSPEHLMNAAKVRWRLAAKDCVTDMLRVLPPYLSAAATYALRRSSLVAIAQGLPALAKDCLGQLAFRGADWQRANMLMALETAAVLDVYDWAMSETRDIPAAQLFVPGDLRACERSAARVFQTWLKAAPEGVRWVYTAEGYDQLLTAAGLRTNKRLLQQIIKRISSKEPLFGPRVTLRIMLACLRDGDIISSRWLASLEPHIFDLKEELKRELLDLGSTLLDGDTGQQRERLRTSWLNVAEASMRLLGDSDIARMYGAVVLSDVYAMIARGPWLELLHKHLPLLNDPEQRKICDELLARADVAVNALLLIVKGKFKRTHAAVWKGKASRAEMVNCLALIIDAGRLTFPWHKFWDDDKAKPSYKKILIEFCCSKAVNATLPMADQIFTMALDPEAEEFSLLAERLTKLISQLGHSLDLSDPAQIPAPRPPASMQNAAARTGANPFALLNLNRTASKADILAATMRQMRARSSALPELRAAQAALLSPESRLVWEFVGEAEAVSFTMASAESGTSQPARGPAPPFKVDCSRLPLRGVWSQQHAARH